MATAMFLVWICLVGAAVGSHLAVFADRWPRGKDVVRAPSACRQCRRVLPWREKIPILSWIALQARCAGCGTPIPTRLWSMEVACALLPLLAWRGAEGDMAGTLVATLFLWALAGLGLCDVTAYRLPDPLMGVLFGAAAGLAWLDPDRTALSAATDAAIGLGAALSLRWGYWLWRGREGLGFGDVLLFGTLALAVGARALPFLALIAATGALGAAVIVSLRRGRELRAGAASPFGAWLCISAGVVWASGLTQVL